VLAGLTTFLSGRKVGPQNIPIFENALKGNDILNAGSIVARLNDPVDLATDGENVFVATQFAIHRLCDDADPVIIHRTTSPITAIASIEGGIAYALHGQEVRILGGLYDGWISMGASGGGFNAINALFADGQRLLISDGSQVHSADEWRRDLMALGSGGRVFSVMPRRGEALLLASGLRYAFGVAGWNGGTLISESWSHRLRFLDEAGKSQVVLNELPAYPSRLARAKDGFWLTMFCARTELVEFVLREDSYRHRMISSIDPDLWICPQLRSFKHSGEPVQWGAVRQRGQVKPWAPPRSYGLVVKLDHTGVPRYSFHSRMGGSFHGIVGAAERHGQLYLLSMGDGVVLRLDIGQAEQGLKR
jgi:hypothetical protein